MTQSCFTPLHKPHPPCRFALFWDEVDTSSVCTPQPPQDTPFPSSVRVSRRDGLNCAAFRDWSVTPMPARKCVDAKTLRLGTVRLHLLIMDHHLHPSRQPPSGDWPTQVAMFHDAGISAEKSSASDCGPSFSVIGVSITPPNSRGSMSPGP